MLAYFSKPASAVGTTWRATVLRLTQLNWTGQEGTQAQYTENQGRCRLGALESSEHVSKTYLPWLASNPQKPTCLCLPSAGIKNHVPPCPGTTGLLPKWFTSQVLEDLTGGILILKIWRREVTNKEPTYSQCYWA